MAQLTITVPDAAVPRIVTAHEAKFGSKGALTNSQFMQKVILDWVRANVAEHEAAAAARAAAATAAASANSDIP